MKTIQIWFSVTLAVCGALFGVYQFVEQRYAYAEDFRQFKSQYVYDRLEQKRDRLQSRIWTLDDRYKDVHMPESVKEEYRSLQEQLKQADSKINSMDNQIKLMSK
jgi:uncharacterized protein YlxW (UPF0749 family)